MLINAIVFDFDGVLADGISFWDKSYSKIFAKHGVELDMDFLHTKIGKTTNQVVQELIEYYSLELDPRTVEDQIQRDVLKTFAVQAKESLHLKHFLKKLKSAGIRIGIASGSCSEAIKIVLKKFEVEEYFEVIVGGEDVCKGKPDPEMILKALEVLGVDPKNAMAIDDARSGILAAKSIGMHTIGYLKYSKKEILEADLNVNDFDEIELNKLAAKSTINS